MRHKTITKRIALLTIWVLAAGAAAQAEYTEDFENNGPVQNGQWGPQNLIAKGGVFRNQSEPTNGPAWYDATALAASPSRARATCRPTRWRPATSAGA